MLYKLMLIGLKLNELGYYIGRPETAFLSDRH